MSNKGINIYVRATAAIAVLAMVVAGMQGPRFPGLWGLFSVFVFAFLLEVSSTTLRGGDAKGSLAFVAELAAGVLFGPFWGGLLTGVSAFAAHKYSRRPTVRAAFNAFQKGFSVVLAIGVYQFLGGAVPPSYLTPGASIVANEVALGLVAFLAASLTYIFVNSLAVSGAIAISTGQPIRQVWKTNTLWVLSYDIGASILSLVIAALYLWFEGMGGIARFGFVAALIPLVVVKHAYSRLNTLQKLYDELDTAYEKLELNLREQLEMMVRSIEARDPYTSGHSRRVAALSKTIATDLGLDAQLVDEIENAALLHDVGKIHAEFAPLLSKEGRLTEEEWEIMKTHSAKSAELVALFSRFKGNVLDSVRWHHERWDGKGYPDGVVAEAIPLGARIIMISDTIDAMSTDRPYRKALSFEKVVSELIKYRGIQFDPNLVDATVNSVTIRRMVSEKDFAAEQSSSLKSDRRPNSRPALRSQKSFWEGLRSSVGQP